MITPEQITQRVKSHYQDYLRAWVAAADDDFFPRRLNANLKTTKASLSQARAEHDRLRNASKSSRGWGYRVQWKRTRSRELGLNDFPEAIWIDTRDDLLFLCDAKEDFQNIQCVVTTLRARMPDLESWLRGNVTRLARLAPIVDDLIGVAEYFMLHPRPGCFARELPLPVDTKFVERNKKVLGAWLDLLLPPCEIDVTEAKFARRYGLRDDSQHDTMNLLDDRLRAELSLPFRELSLTRCDMARLPVEDCKVLIVENRTNLLTLPPLIRGIGLGGKGKAVSLCRFVPWLRNCRVFYWGDMDVPGFEILSNLRSHLSVTVESLMMDLEALRRFEGLTQSKATTRKPSPQNLTPAEVAAYEQICANQIWLEQERIPQAAVMDCLETLGQTVRKNSRS